MINQIFIFWKRVLPAMGVLLISGAALGQSIQLSPAQQQMLDQLPAAQREQALRQIELLQQGADNSQVPGLSGDTTDLIPAFDLPVVEEEPEEPRAERRSRVIVSVAGAYRGTEVKTRRWFPKSLSGEGGIGRFWIF